MRRPTAMMLVVMGGGLALWGATRGPSRGCLDARAQQRPDAEAICASSSSGSGHGSSAYHSGSSSTSGTAMAAVSRGGFGGAGHAAAAGS